MMRVRKDMEWFWFASLSALFAALTAILAKIGIENVNSNLATAIRTAVVLALAWGIVLADGSVHGIGSISPKSWVFLILSGLATGASWLCYFRAIQEGEVSKVVPIDKMSTVLTIILALILFHETFSLKTALGIVLITAGTLIMTL
jgi:transporter family protein